MQRAANQRRSISIVFEVLYVQHYCGAVCTVLVNEVREWFVQTGVEPLLTG